VRGRAERATARTVETKSLRVEASPTAHLLAELQLVQRQS